MTIITTIAMATHNSIVIMEYQVIAANSKTLDFTTAATAKVY